MNISKKNILLALSFASFLLPFVSAQDLTNNYATPLPLPIPDVIWDVTHVNENHAALRTGNQYSICSDLSKLMIQAKSFLAQNPTKTLKLFFPAGVYKFDTCGYAIDGFQSGKLWVHGAGTGKTIFLYSISDSPANINDFPLRIKESKNVTFSGIHLERYGFYSPHFQVIGRNDSLGSKSYTLKLLDGYPSPEKLAPLVGTSWGNVALLTYEYAALDPEHKPIRMPYPNIVTGATADESPFIPVKGQPGVYTVLLRSQARSYPTKVGDYVAAKVRSGMATIAIVRSNYVALRDILITRGANQAVFTYSTSDHLTVEKMRITRPVDVQFPGEFAGGKPFLSQPGGGIVAFAYHTDPQEKRNGAVVKDCFIQSTADDAIAVGTWGSHDLLMDGPSVTGNTIMDNQARAILVLPLTNGLVRGNKIIRSESGLWLRNHDDVQDGKSSVQNLRIIQNIFNITSGGPAIGFLDESGAKGGLHTQIDINNNEFLMASQKNPLISVANAGQVNIANNRVKSFMQAVDVNFFENPLRPNEPLITSLVYVNDAVKITGRNNVTVALEGSQQVTGASSKWTGTFPISLFMIGK